MQAARGASLNPSDESTPEPSDPDRPSSRKQPSGAPPASRRRHLALFATIAVLGYAADVVSKAVVVATLSGHDPVPVVGRFFMLSLTYNQGASFSMGTSYTVVFSLVAIVAAVAVLWVARRLASVGWAIGLGFLLAGVVGNLTDRIFRGDAVLSGHVVDFLRFPHFPVFNVADVCINIAAACIIVQAVRGVRVDGTRQGDQEEPARP